MTRAELKGFLREKAEKLHELAENLGDIGRPLNAKEQRMIREVQSEVMLDHAKESITIWMVTGEWEHLDMFSKSLYKMSTIKSGK